MSVTLAAEAELELVASARYYAAEADAALAESFIQEFERCARLLEQQPLLGIRSFDVTRRFPLRRFPFNIVYTVRGDNIEIIALAHQRRKPGYWRSRT